MEEHRIIDYPSLNAIMEQLLLEGRNSMRLQRRRSTPHDRSVRNHSPPHRLSLLVVNGR